MQHPGYYLMGTVDKVAGAWSQLLTFR